MQFIDPSLNCNLISTDQLNIVIINLRFSLTESWIALRQEELWHSDNYRPQEGRVDRWRSFKTTSTLEQDIEYAG